MLSLGTATQYISLVYLPQCLVYTSILIKWVFLVCCLFSVIVTNIDKVALFFFFFCCFWDPTVLPICVQPELNNPCSQQSVDPLQPYLMSYNYFWPCHAVAIDFVLFFLQYLCSRVCRCQNDVSHCSSGIFFQILDDVLASLIHKLCLVFVDSDTVATGLIFRTQSLISARTIPAPWVSAWVEWLPFLRKL